eukprot:s5179_g2.t1
MSSPLESDLPGSASPEPPGSRSLHVDVLPYSCRVAEVHHAGAALALGDRLEEMDQLVLVHFFDAERIQRIPHRGRIASWCRSCCVQRANVFQAGVKTPGNAHDRRPQDHGSQIKEAGGERSIDQRDGPKQPW